MISVMPSAQSDRILRRLAASLPLALALSGSFALALPATGQQTTPAVPGPLNPAQANRAEQAYLAGARMLQRQDLAGAQAQFTTAAKLDPNRQDYAKALTLTRDHRISDLVQQAATARMMNDTKRAEALLAEARAIDPANELVLEHDADALMGTKDRTAISPAHDVVYAPPIHLEPATGLHDVHVRGDAKTVLTQAASLYGIKTVFDSSVTSDAPQVRFDLDQASYKQVLPILLKMTKSFAVPADKKTLVIARDAEENRKRLERQLEETIFVPGSTPEQLNELTNIIKNVFDVKQVVIQAGSGTLAIRAPEPTLTALNEVLKDLIDGGSEVMIEIKLLEVDKSRIVNTGLSTPNSVGLISVSGEAQSIVSANQSLVQELISSGGYVPTGNTATDTIVEALYLVLSGAVTDAKVSGLVALVGGGLTLGGVYLTGGVTLNFGLTSSDTRALDDINVRVGNRQETVLRVGEKYPITTATYSSGISSSTASALAGVTINGVSASSLLAAYSGTAATIPQIQYEDLGITLKTTPTVLKSGLVEMKIDLKIESLAGDSLDNIPVLTSRAFVSDMTVKDGASAIMLSDLTKTETATISGLPGLGEIPGFQESAADRLKEVDSSELILLITPRVVKNRSSLSASRRVPFESTAPQEF